ncbi:MAG TPA: inorganic phosphate transporter [Bacteroidia bacterium]|nr:inorganic phosphate transporter [Bacteroidia bacterium]
MTTGILILLIVCLLLACSFEFVNGFHDTANAVATVIYTNTLKPTVAVVWSGLWNFLGVLTGGIGVAMGIVNLLPVETLTDANMAHGMAMVFALLLSAICWNLGTWYLGIPASSSHSLIGSILGIGLAFYFIDGKDAVNWGKAQDIGLSLLVSPLVGFALAIIFMFIFKRLIKNDAIYKEPLPDVKPPLWIRVILTITCTLVSFFHGQNDGQKGVGLVMLILIGLVPGYFAIKDTQDLTVTYQQMTHVKELVYRMDTTKLSEKENIDILKTKTRCQKTLAILENKKSVTELDSAGRFDVRKNVILVSKSSEKIGLGENSSLTLKEKNDLKSTVKELKQVTDYAPKWVIIMISLSLGLGTMIGWKRIVKTIGEKIGKQHMSYAQGASAELVASTTIGMASAWNLPVSTTHVLSSGVAGAMVAKKGLKNLQPKTIKAIFMAWVLTLPVTMILSGALFLLFRWLF